MINFLSGSKSSRGAAYDEATIKSTRNHGGFDPTGLERAAKAARDIEGSAHAELAFDVFQQHELTKQLALGVQQAEYEMRARHYEAVRTKDEGVEARQTLAAQTEHVNQQAKYTDDLERQRHATQLAAQRHAREAELKRIEYSIERQEDLRRGTLRYEADLRSKTELKLAEAQAQAKAQSERENHDLSLERLREEMKERRETLLQSISVGFSSFGGGAKVFLGNRFQMGNAVAFASFLALGVYGARVSARVAGNYLASRLGKPPLVRETSRATPLSLAQLPTAAWRSTKSRLESDVLHRVILEESLERRLRHVATSTKYSKRNRAPFRHVLLHGPPGTGKTMFAKQLAVHSGLDYAILTGGDISPLGRDAVNEIYRLFDWARQSKNGLLLFIDEAEAFLRNRASNNISEDLRNAFNAFLYCFPSSVSLLPLNILHCFFPFPGTGEPSCDFMLVYASNAPEDFDWAINDRIDEIVEFALPTEAERRRMLIQYTGEHMANLQGDNSDPAHDERLIKSVVAATEGFSGREIQKLAVAWQAAALNANSIEWDPDTAMDILHAHAQQRKLKSSWSD